MKGDLDQIDHVLLTALLQDARMSWSELAGRAGVSAPTARERVRRLQDIGVIQGFSADLSAAALGYNLKAIVRFKPLPGKRHILEQKIQETPQIVQCDKVTGEDAFVARLVLRAIVDLDPLLDRFSRCATTHTSVVKTSPVPHRAPPF